MEEEEEWDAVVLGPVGWSPELLSEEGRQNHQCASKAGCHQPHLIFNSKICASDGVVRKYYQINDSDRWLMYLDLGLT